MAQPKSPSSASWLFFKIKSFVPGIVFLALINAILALSFIWLALLSETLIDTAALIMQDPPSQSVWDCLLLPQIYIPALQVMGIVILQILLNIFSSLVRVKTSGRLEISLRETVFSSLLRKEYEQFHRYHSGELLNRLTADISHVVNGVTGLIPAAVSMLTKLVGGLWVLTRISPWFTVAMVGLGLVLVIGSRFYGKPLKKLHKACQETDGKTRSFMQEALENLLSVKAFSGENAMEDRLDTCQQTNFLLRIKRVRVSNIGNTVIYLALTGAYYLALIWGVVCLIAGTLTFGTLTALLQIFEQLKQPLRNASSLLPQYYAMLASAERLEELEQLPAEEAPLMADDRYQLLTAFSALSAEDIAFAYDRDTPVLDHLSFTVHRGEIVSLVGESGIGKSTLMKLVLSILRPQNGKLTAICGEKVFPLTAATRALFSYVPQGNAVFAGTLRENLSLFRSSVSDEAVQKALHLACLDAFLADLPDGLDTVLGEHGFDISEGQAQRIAIARALLSDAPVLLLDECTSALDNATETQLLCNIKELTDKTVLMISHRSTTVAGGDRVLRLADHRLTEE